MNNALRLGAAVAATALVGLSSDSAEGIITTDPIRVDTVNSQPPIDRCSRETKKLASKLVQTELALREAQRELQAIRDESGERVAECIMQLEAMEATCGDAVPEDGAERDVSGEHHIKDIGGGGPFFLWQ